MGSLKLLIFVIWGMVFVPYAFGQAVQDRQASAKPPSPFKVAILPLTTHSPENLSYMQEGLLDMLSSRVELNGRVVVLEKGAVKKALAGTTEEMDSVAARTLGQALGADFVVFGSLTKLGDSASLDLKVVEVKGEKPAAVVYIQARKMEEVIAGVDELGRRVDEKILGYPLTPPVAEKPVEKPMEVAAVPRPPVPPTSSRTVSPPAPSKMAVAGEQWRSQSIPFKVVGMDIGDVDGDGRNELILIEERRVWIYHWDGELKVLKTMEGEKFDRYLAVDVVDARKNGRAEIFVTNFQKDRLSSFVVAYSDGNFKVVSSGLDWYFRAVDWGEKGRALFSQKKGADEGFSGPIYEFGWDGKKYKDMRKAKIPKGINLYGFAPFSHDGKADFVYIDSDFKLKMMNEKGKVIWRGKEDYGSDNKFQVKYLDVMGNYPDESAFINVRVIAKGEDIFIIRNISAIGQLFARAKYYNKGEVKRLTWNGAMFMESWRSQEISGYLADFQYQERKQDQAKELIVAVNLPKESILSVDSSSTLMVSPLPAGQ
jgi:TolB-like protein